jgi:predicted O-methyltransferase YrrM
LLNFLNPRLPLPPMEKAAITPELALRLATRIAEDNPALVVEMGSGISTLVAGYSLQKNGCGRLISLEHDAFYAQQTSKLVERHHLRSYVEVLHAPLTSIDIQGGRYSWYDRSILRMIEPRSIGVLLVDGPPGPLQKLARYPVLPVLYEYLRDDALIMVDDADRQDEREMIDRWRQEFRCLKIDYLTSVKGIAEITFDRRPASINRKFRPRSDSETNR